MTNKKVEIEYRFKMPMASLMIVPPLKILNLVRAEKDELKIIDIILETKDNSLKKNDIGIRIRKENTNFDLTYKKYIGENSDNLAKFEELNLQLSEADFNNALKGKFELIHTMVEVAKKACIDISNLTTLMCINNLRVVYTYKSDFSKAELTLERVIYSRGEQSAIEALIEIEMINAQSIPKEFVDNLREIYSAEATAEGKNTRGMRLLDLKYE